VQRSALTLAERDPLTNIYCTRVAVRRLETRPMITCGPRRILLDNSSQAALARLV